jgi:hypothetical protein
MASRRTPKTKVVAFKVEEDLANLLNTLPNKSAFIRRAIEAQLGSPCPLCAGKGVVPRGIYEHYAPLIRKNDEHPCDGCGTKVHLPLDPGTLSADDHTRLEQFFFGGPLYCDGCFEKAPPCTACGWHIDKEHILDHVRKAHTD